jgi:hypothetical protein
MLAETYDREAAHAAGTQPVQLAPIGVAYALRWMELGQARIEPPIEILFAPRQDQPTL